MPTLSFTTKHCTNVTTYSYWKIIETEFIKVIDNVKDIEECPWSNLEQLNWYTILSYCQRHFPPEVENVIAVRLYPEDNNMGYMNNIHHNIQLYEVDITLNDTKTISMGFIFIIDANVSS